MYHVGSVISSFFKDHSWYHRRGSKSVLGLKARYKGPSGFHHRICTLKRLDIYTIRKSFAGDSDNLEIIRLLKELYIQRIIFGHEIVFHFPFISTACISCAGAIGILLFLFKGLKRLSFEFFVFEILCVHAPVLMIDSKCLSKNKGFPLFHSKFRRILWIKLKSPFDLNVLQIPIGNFTKLNAKFVLFPCSTWGNPYEFYLLKLIIYAKIF